MNYITLNQALLWLVLPIVATALPVIIYLGGAALRERQENNKLRMEIRKLETLRRLGRAVETDPVYWKNREIEAGKIWRLLAARCLTCDATLHPVIGCPMCNMEKHRKKKP